MKTKTESKEELVERLLREHEEKQKKKKGKERMKKREMEDLHDQYVKVFDTLKVPHSDIIIIRNLEFKRTLVRAYDRVFAFAYLRNPHLGICNPYIRDEYDFAYIENSSRSLEERVLNVGCPSYYRCDIAEMNSNCDYREDAYVNGNEKVHVFYGDSAELCPFCGDLSSKRNKDIDGLFFSDSYLSSLRTQEVLYKRCCDHDNMSRKDYLNSYKKNPWENPLIKKEKSYLENLRDSIYPAPIKHDRKYFEDKKDQKEEKERRKTYSHFKGIKGLYKKRGFYYWQPPQKDRVRPKPIALRTKDLDEALKNLDEIWEEFESAQYIESGNVYLMKNDLNSRIKIGRTKGEPVYRERTLQSQEPEVSLIFHREVGDMNGTESFLHNFFASKRLRGEWFELSDDDIEKAKSFIEEASRTPIT